MFKTDVHLVSFILNGIAAAPSDIPRAPVPRGRRRRRPSAFVERGQRNYHPALARYRSERFVFLVVLHSHHSCFIPTLPISSGVCTARALGDLSLRDCPCPCWMGAIYRCIRYFVSQDGISLTRAHLEKYSLAPADRYRTTDVRLHHQAATPCWTAGVREMLSCPILLNVSRSGRHFSQYW